MRTYDLELLVTYLKIYSHIAGSFLLFCPLLLAPQNIQTSRIFSKRYTTAL